MIQLPETALLTETKFLLLFNCSNIVKEKCKAKMKKLLIKLFSDPETHAPNSSSSLCLGGAVNSVFRT